MIKEIGMFKDLSGKFGLAIPEGSLIKKLESIKKASVTHETGGGALSQDVIEKLREELKKTPEELDKKIEEMVNSKSEQIKANTDAVKNIESQVSKVEQTVSSGKKGIDDFKTRLDKMDETVLELLSLYEVVSSTVNPFVDIKEGPVAEKLADIEKKVEELSQKTPEIPVNLTTVLDNKFKALESNMEDLKKRMDSNVINEEALVEKVAGQVLEHIKPAMQAPKPGVSSIPQAAKAFAQQTAETSRYNEDQSVRLAVLDNRHETSVILMNWIQFLLEKAGRNNLIDILEYYVEIGWISEEVSSTMMNYASGIDYYIEKTTWKLLPQDHAKSLLFIEQLTGKKIDKNLISRLERDLDKIIRSEVLVI